MKYLKIIVPVVVLGILAFLYFNKSEKKEQLFDYLPVKLSRDAREISLIDYNGTVILEDAFKASSKIYPINDVITEITQEGKTNYWIIKNKEKVKLIDKEFEAGTPFYEDVAVVRDEEGKLSLINKKGEALIANLSQLKEYNVVRTGVMSDGLLRFKTDAGKWGYVDKTGNIIIQPSFTKCENFANGRARVITENNEFKIINKKGEQEFKGEEETTYLPVVDNNIIAGKIYYGIKDLKGNSVINNDKYTNLGILSAGIVSAANESGEWGVINTKQEVVGDLSFHFKEKPVISKTGFVIAKSDGDLKLYNKKGRLITSLEDYSYVFPITYNKFLAFKNRELKFDLINEKGKAIGEKSFESAIDPELMDFAEFFESPKVVMNHFTIESTYFDFEKLYDNTFVSVSTDDISGVNNSYNIESVIQSFPYIESVPYVKPISQIEHFDIQFYYPSASKPYSNFKGKSNAGETIKEPTPTTGTASATVSVETPKIEIKSNPVETEDGYITTPNQDYETIPTPPEDKYPYLTTTTQSYTTYRGNYAFAFKFTFNANLKSYEYDNYYQTSINKPNLAARLMNIEISFSENYRNNQLLKNKLQQKLISIGWTVNKQDNFLINLVNKKNKNTIIITNSNLIMNFENTYIPPSTTTTAPIN